MTGLYTEAFLEDLRAHAGGLASQWGLSPETQATLLNISENATFRLDDPQAGAPVVVRVHRPAYHTPAEIASEIAWLEALRAEQVVATPAILPVAGGGKVATFVHDGETRHAVAFEWMEGAEPQAGAGLVPGFRDLGAISARLHAHVRRWAKPTGFIRKTWNWETTVGPVMHWGDWRDADGLDAEGRAILERTAQALRARLGAYGEGADRFGLIHADLRLANLLEGDGRLGVIDFDDCGFGWFAYDFAAAISFLETEPYIPDLAAAWLEGYAAVAPLPPEAEAMLPHMIMLRRMLLTAWIASHAETPTAQELVADGYTSGTVALAERHLATV
ncbi:phosphotransferase enzyme family protein [Albimonas pacifica]|uniref:Ser/Thr protein kinase RdoA involved in Cpx stress response, MazF antagonist n=1 Tax=Albimonas pacifica TaxID=1114924 RepID=A0A1I3DDT0_9RHOB|nr:phosphotransferase [Albimonas pacifica]SFH84922.1 Ser/Thr protein kinase RdoA involved in Cpx stress response, MazF antagonist [Albimonas pacifica]